MSQKKHLDLLCFVSPKGKGYSVHLFVHKLLTNLIKIQELPTIIGGAPPPCRFFFRKGGGLRTLHLPAGYARLLFPSNFFHSYIS